MSGDALTAKLADLRAELRAAQPVAVALSGGVDSVFLCAVAREELGREGLLAVTVRAPFFPDWELEDAREVARARDIRHAELDAPAMDSEHFRSNPPDRCYHCKRTLMGELIRVAGDEGITYVADGTNADDVDDFRPGMRASAELGINHPLRDAELTKADIRELSRRMGLSTHDKPSAACLASRVPYGDRITDEKLQRIERAERFLHTLGFRDVRVRTHGALARIETGPGEPAGILLEPPTRDAVVAALREAGYDYIALDLEGYRTGSMNEALTEDQKTKATRH